MVRDAPRAPAVRLALECATQARDSDRSVSANGLSGEAVELEEPMVADGGALLRPVRDNQFGCLGRHAEFGSASAAAVNLRLQCAGGEAAEPLVLAARDRGECLDRFWRQHDRDGLARTVVVTCRTAGRAFRPRT